ncbi:MAG: 1-(5-phosphoribosyl)-5-[(5-phosphoribosylamino)methylideneamino] imidazole-4-carboxamide isomerase [Myxococcaceae bacterium]|jgi:phosphoribosylformimino-5-aminoimidazole carboxamide ribotide isomerase|nr:1-(5-phosphoribosyl)-5-[(5-phosphoribosylamino)methylideneamino] imidazole-4-carboxamide isomerase [Myxococcaceae bacterium]MCA3011671.1 1-(5-phosphoribosyl)-5-[(5-phosphoribosylamino)methylideneamino] imidazole-4-carboxamide isomerase [Myxococcaceae bacterium]
MKAIPAIDLREGACVQLVGGAYEAERVRLPDPLDVARGWREAGFGSLHVVDLDAATGRGSNAALIEQLVRGADVQVGGGVRDEAAVARLLALGAARVVVGTRGVEDAAWLEAVARAHPGRVVLAADVKGRAVVTRGWAATTTLDVLALLARVRALPLAGVLVTAVHLEGQLQGTDVGLFREVVAASPVPVIASGGVTTADDLRALQSTGCHAAVIGMALYTGRLDAPAIAREFPS